MSEVRADAREGLSARTSPSPGFLHHKFTTAIPDVPGAIFVALRRARS